MRSRPGKDSREGARHQKKLEEFLKAIEGKEGNLEETKAKFKEIMVKSNILKENDWLAVTYLETLAALQKA